ncbi:nuclear transport factor 2 family protein [Marilutibacter chinensis]|uniref:Nuclear transport factor 2 family protein n=1 Tax=Marilutibacter chinensis TaxID=2912247 RepID=A0ABS9HSG7_9GAMM|nr:nuclear transport factor 2 family protein [Lysobacter chinensis]MCF7221866.1 nuclear transport factor 2 family protein [Lysobacter chinensis]
MDDTRARQALIDRYIAAYNAFDVDGMLAVLAPDVRFENFSAGRLTAQAHGIEAFRQLAGHAAALFSEREQRVTARRDHADRVVVDIAYRGVLAADIPDGPKAGTVLEMTGQSEFEFADGRISRIVDRS